VTATERRYPAFDGLNLSWETLEGIVKHNGPLTDPEGNPIGKYLENGVPQGIADYDAANNLALWSHASAEAQVAAIADDIAYDAHDLDDGLRAGLFQIEDLRDVSFLDGLLDEIEKLWPRLEPARAIHELTRRVITRFVEDAITEGQSRIASLKPDSVDAIRGAARPVIAFSQGMAAADKAIKQFLFPRMYRHPRVMRVMQGAEEIVRDLFAIYRADREEMPEEWRDLGDGPDRAAADFIAGMTDRYAVQEHRRLFDATPDLR
jgi:dGTPase